MYSPTSYHDLTKAPIIPNAHNIIEVVQSTKSSSLVVVPAFLEEWATSSQAVDILRSLEYVVRISILFLPPVFNVHPPRLLGAGRLPKKRVMRWWLLASSSRLYMAGQSLVPSHIYSGILLNNIFGSGYVLDQIRVYDGCCRVMARMSVSCWCVIVGSSRFHSAKLTFDGSWPCLCLCRPVRRTSSLSRISPTSRATQPRMYSSNIRPLRGCIKCMSPVHC